MIEKLIATGLMKYLVENYYTKKLEFKKLQKEPKVLSVDDLAFGFNIWLVVCCFSFSIFIIEILAQNLRYKKNKNAKIHPIMLTKTNETLKVKLKLETIQKFRIIVNKNENTVEVKETEENSTESENNKAEILETKMEDDVELNIQNKLSANNLTKSLQSIDSIEVIETLIDKIQNS